MCRRQEPDILLIFNTRHLSTVLDLSAIGIERKDHRYGSKSGICIGLIKIKGLIRFS